MVEQPTARILVIGNEVLKGEVKEINSLFLQERLLKRGIMVKGISIIPDDRKEIVETIHREHSRCTYYFVCGGIGPTHDDVTRLAVAEAFKCKLKYHEGMAQALRNFYRDNTNEIILQMAWIPAKGGPMGGNPDLPGFQIKNVFVLPGYPRYLKAGFQGVESSLARGRFFQKTLHTQLDESLIALLLEEVESSFEGLSIGSYPSGYESNYRVKLTLFAYSEEVVHGAATFLRERLKTLELSHQKPKVRGGSGRVAKSKKGE